MPHINTELADVAYEAGGPGQGAAGLLGSPGDVRAWPEPAESEARFRTLITSSPLAMLVIDQDATVRLWNAAAEKLFGWTEAEVIGKAVPFIPDGRLPECISCRDTAMRGEIYAIETQRLRRDGSLLDLRLSAAPLRDKRGEVTEILVLFDDVTERKRAESLLAAERRVLELIATGAPLPQVLDTLVDETEKNSNEGMLCSILLADDSGERLLHGAAPTLPETYNQAIHGIRIGPNVGSCGTAAYERRPVFVCDIASDPRWMDFKGLAARHGLGACCSTPLLSSQGKLLGTLAMYYRQPHDPGVHERQLIERATHLAAIVIERERSEGALRLSRENLTAALAASDTGTFRWNPHTGEFSEFDENLKRLFGFAPDEPVRVTQDFLNRVHPDDLPKLIQTVDSARQGADFAMEYRVILPDGKIRWLYDRAKMVRNAEGIATDLVGACTDITERKQAEQALAAREREFRTLADNMSQFAWMTDAAGWIYWYNQRWYHYTGTTLEQMQGWGWREVHHPDHVDRVVSKIKHCFDTGEIWEDTFPLRSKDGEYHWFLSRALPIRDDQGQIVRWFGTNTDVTEQREAGEALRESEQRFRTMSDNIAQLAWTCDRLGDVTWYNQRWLDYTGLTFEDMKDWGWKKVQHPDHVDRIVASVMRSRDTGEIWEDTFPLRGKDGNYRWFLSRAVPIRDAAGNVVRWFGTNTDVSDLRDAEARQQLLINELNHRVKNTLATVQAIAAQTLRNANVDSSVRETFESRLVALSNVHNILTQERWETAGIRDIMARTLEPHAGPDRLRVHGPSVRLSPKAALAIAMGMHELVTNAVKYGALSNGTGQVAVTWRVDGPKPGTLHLQWKERGGPTVKPPSRKGFGSRLIERNLEHDLNGKAKIAYQPEGIVCTITSTLGAAFGENPKGHS